MVEITEMDVILRVYNPHVKPRICLQTCNRRSSSESRFHIVTCETEVTGSVCVYEGSMVVQGTQEELGLEIGRLWTDA